MKLIQTDGAILVVPDDAPEEELIVIDLDDDDVVEPQPLGWRIVDANGKPMGGNQ